MSVTDPAYQSVAEAAPLKPLLIDVRQFMSLLQIKRSTAFQLIRDKRIQSVLIGRSRRIVLADAERMVADALRRERH